MANDFDRMDVALWKFNKTLNTLGAGLSFAGLFQKLKQAQAELRKLDDYIRTPDFDAAASAEVDQFIASLERLDKALSNIPRLANNFDPLIATIKEMDERLESFTRNLAELRSSATPLPGRTNIGNAPKADAAFPGSGTASVQTETQAYREQVREIDAVMASKRENIALIERLKAQNRDYKSTLDAIAKEEQRWGKISDEQAAKRERLALAIEENKVAISALQRDLKQQIKVEQSADASIDEMTASLERLRAVYRSLGQSDRGSAFGQDIARNIEELERRINGLGTVAQNTGVQMQAQTRQAGVYASGFNGLSYQIQQVARELPSLAYGPQIFFSAISNNLPMLTDEIARARIQYQELVKAGQKATPVWRQMLSSVVSWQSLIVAGVTVLTLYGKEIVEWAGSLIKGKKAFDAAKAAMQQFHTMMVKGRVEAQKEIVQLDALYRVASDAARPYDERRAAVKKLQEVYPAYFGNMTAEQIMVGEAIDKYNTLREAILATAEARAAADAITENQKQTTLLKQTGDAYEKYKNALDDVAEAKKKYDAADKEYYINPAGVKVETTDELVVLEGARRRAREARKEFEKELLKLSGGEELWAQIKEKFDENINDFEENIRLQNERLLPLVDRVAAGQTVEDQNKAAEEARRAADKAAEEARRRADREREEQTRASENLIELLTRLRNDARQAEIDAMAEGTDKKIAQINYDYDRQEETIKKREEELERLAAQAGTEVSEQDRGYLSALRTDNELTRSNALSQIEIDEIEAEERAMDEYLAKYGDYQEKRFAITKQYAEKIAKAQTDGERLLYGKQQEEALRNLDLSMVEASNLWTRLFKDAGTMATSSINGVIEDVERLLKYIDQVQSGGDADMSIIAALGLTKEQVDTLMADPKKIEAILDALKQKRDELNTRNPFGALIQGFKDLKKAAGDADVQMAAVNKIIAGAQGAAQLIGDVGDSMSELGEAIGSDFVSGFGSAMSEISDVVNSAINGAMTGMAVGGPVGAAIGAGVGLLTGVISGIGKRLQYNKQVREEYQNTLRKEYLAEYEINALYRERYEWAKKIGEATLSYLNRNTKEAQSQYEANQREQEELWAKLMGSEYVSSERYKHGTWFRKAKIIKGYSTLAGKSWEDIELLAAQGKLTKEAQEYYEALKKAREEGEELEERMEQIAEETREAFTGIGFDSLVDGIVEGFKSGKRSMSDFADDFEDMMKNAVLQSLKMTALEEPLRKWYEDFAAAAGDNNGLTQQEIEELKASYTRIIENAGRQADELERITGISLGAGAEAQTATARGFQAMSQETGSELNGRFTAIQGDIHDIKAFVIEQTNNGTQLLNETVNIRDIMIQLNGNVADIRTYTKVLPAMSEKLDRIVKNTDAI